MVYFFKIKMIHLEFILLNDMRYVSNFIFLQVAYPVVCFWFFWTTFDFLMIWDTAFIKSQFQILHSHM